MMFQVSTILLSMFVATSLASLCPEKCVCNTRDGLHRATCSSLVDLYKFTLRQKHHNINVLDLSHNNITKLSHELDRLTEVVTLDLSTNGITELNKFLNNAKKLVHLNLANNRIEKLSFIQVPASVSSLDLTNNLLQDVPADFERLVGLEHLELDGNPLRCSCENIRARDRFLASNVYIDKAKCSTPAHLKGKSWLELKVRDVCKTTKSEVNYLDMMMGDQPIDAVAIGEDTSALKSDSDKSISTLEEGNVIGGEKLSENDDNQQFLKVNQESGANKEQIEGSGDLESSTIYDFLQPVSEANMNATTLNFDEIITTDAYQTTEDPEEGSGEGSGFVPLGIVSESTTPITDDSTKYLETTVTSDVDLFDKGFSTSDDYSNYADYEDIKIDTTTARVEDLNPGPVIRVFGDDDKMEENSTEYPIPKPPSIFEGGPFWQSISEMPVSTTEKLPFTPQIIPDTTISQKVTKELESKPLENDNQPHKTGTYVCIAIIIVLLVGLIGFAIVKGQMRKRRDRRLLRQQKRDVEKASKEMIDMNKSLLGKPAVIEPSPEKKVNGKYELVPTHETPLKNNKNGEIAKGISEDAKTTNSNPRTDSPRDSNQNKSSSKDNNLLDSSLDSAVPESNDSRKNSLSSEDIFIPVNDNSAPKLNGTGESSLSPPLMNGDQNTDSDLLSPSRDYVPIYSPDMGRVRIKMTETPKPKTPVLVTRSRSNAGDIIITPTLDGNLRKSTT